MIAPGSRFLLQKASSLAAVVVAASAVFGGVLWLSPGSPAADGEGSPSFLGWLGSFWMGVLTGDLGISHRGLPVLTLVGNGALRTLPLVGLALLMAVILGLLLASTARLLPPSLRSLFLLLVQGVSLVPLFLLAYAASAWGADPTNHPTLTFLAAALALTVGNGALGEATLHLEAELADLLDRDYIHATRSRGASLWRHLAPSMWIQGATVMAGKAPGLLGGALIVEWVLTLPGWGYYGYAAARNEDFPLLMAIAVAATFSVALLQWVAEAVRVAVDPRLRQKGRAP